MMFSWQHILTTYTLAIRLNLKIISAFRLREIVSIAHSRWCRGSMKTGPQENSSALKNALWKLVLLQNVLGKVVRKFSDGFFWQNNDVCRNFIAALDSKPMSLSSMRWQSQADIARNQPISLTIFILLINGRIGHEGQQWPHNRVNLKYTVVFLAPLVHTDLLLADITSTPRNPTLSRYLMWLADFNLISQISMPIRDGQYLSMPMWSMYGIWIRQMWSADILRLLSAIRYDFFILPLFNNKQANFANFRPFVSCLGRNL